MTEKEETRRLWELCFNRNDDDVAFTKLYFSERYSDKVNMTSSCDGKIVSAMQLLPYPMTFGGQTIPTSYISGACTDPEYRRKGLMTELIAKALRQMKQQGIYLSTLIPASDSLFLFYEDSQFDTVFYNRKQVIPSDELPLKEEIIVTPFRKGEHDVYPYFARKMQQRNNCLQHTPEDFRVILKDMNLFEDTLYVARLDNDIVGLAFSYPIGDQLYIREVLTEFPFVEETLIAVAARNANAKKITVTYPPDGSKNDKQLGMARIVSLEALLNVYAQAHPSLTDSFRVTDHIIPENSGTYIINKGKVEKNNSTIPPPVLMSHLNRYLLKPSYMSLMLD